MKTKGYTLCQDEWLKANIKNYKRYVDLADAFNNEFNETRTYYSIQNRVRKLGISLSPIKRIYTKEQNEWLLQNAYNYETYELLTQKFNEIFNSNVHWKIICSHLHDIGFSKKAYTEEEIQWLTNNYKKFSDYQALTDAYNENFDNKRTLIAIQSCCNRLGIKFRNEKIKDVGYESVKKDGTILVKVNNGKIDDENSQYIPKARYIWEQHNGKIPSGYTVIHLDNDKSNNDITNLMCVPKKVQQTISRLMSENPEVTMTAVKIGELLVAIRK